MWYNMCKQKGQSAVEFALVAPMFFLICFAAIYAGITFMDYLNFSNYARTVAREISLTVNDDGDNQNQIDKRIEEINNKDTKDIELSSLYEKTLNAEQVNSDVKVEVKFKLPEDNVLPSILVNTGFPPKEFKITYIMPLEKVKSSSEETTETNN